MDLSTRKVERTSAGKKKKSPSKTTLASAATNKKARAADITPTKLEKLCPGALENVCKQFASWNYSVLRYAPVQNRQLEARFLQAMKGLDPATHSPTLLYHGTRKENVSPICQSGLLIPGKGKVRVANGSAYGVGIYTARTPNISAGYSKDGLKMFVCLGLIGPTITTTKQAGDIFVFFEERLLVPMWVVEFRMGRVDKSGRKPERLPMHELLGISKQEVLSVKQQSSKGGKPKQVTSSKKRQKKNK